MSKKQNTAKLTAKVLKSDTPDVNGRIYSKEALEQSVKEYNEKLYRHVFDVETPVIEAKKDNCIVELKAFWNKPLEDSVKKEMWSMINDIYYKNHEFDYSVIYKHDNVNTLQHVKPYFIDHEKIVEILKQQGIELKLKEKKIINNEIRAL
jgi:peptidoglycan/xylan/chitin deacetylase (PgdA/CDA1 family)